MFASYLVAGPVRPTHPHHPHNPSPLQEFYVQRLNARQLLQPLLRRPLSRSEARAIMGEAKCCVCMRYGRGCKGGGSTWASTVGSGRGKTRAHGKEAGCAWGVV